MGKNDSSGYKTEETAEAFQGSGHSTSFENIKNIIADQLKNFAETIGGQGTEPEAQSGMTQEKLVSEWLTHSAEYIREFDYEQADSRVRKYIGQNPGRSLLIAGGVGLIVGAVLRRR